MALSSSRLATALEDVIRSGIGLGATAYPNLTSFCSALATAIVTEIQGHAAITSGVANGVTGTASAPVTGGNAAVPALSITNVAVTGGVG